jgi:hypothetical protein
VDPAVQIVVTTVTTTMDILHVGASPSPTTGPRATLGHPTAVSGVPRDRPHRQ